MSENKKRSHRANIVKNCSDKDGKGFDVMLEALPLDGRVVLRVDEPKPSTAPGDR